MLFTLRFAPAVAVPAPPVLNNLQLITPPSSPVLGAIKEVEEPTTVSMAVDQPTGADGVYRGGPLIISKLLERFTAPPAQSTTCPQSQNVITIPLLPCSSLPSPPPSPPPVVPRLAYDLGVSPHLCTIPPELLATLGELVTAYPTPYIRILSPEHPWTIELSRRDADSLTPSDILQGLYRALQVPLTWMEWKLASERQKAVMARAVKAKTGCDSKVETRLRFPSERVRRVDWLGAKTGLVRLKRDDRMVADMLGVVEEKMGPTFIAVLTDC